jgi:hypothetical protein
MAAVGRTPLQPAHRPAPRRESDDAGLMARLSRMADAAGAPATRLMADFAALSLGPGHLSAADYEHLRLFDDGLWGAADRREVAGARRGHEIVRQANFRADAFGLVSDRLACDGYLAAHGLPTVPLLAIFRAGLATSANNLLRDRGELRDFLKAHSNRPLVAQPAEGGRARLLFADRGHDPAADIERLIVESGDTPGVSWLLQPLLAPHPSYAKLTGGRLAAVQLLTLSGDTGVGVFRAHWRLGGRDDLVASLDVQTGHALDLFPAAAPHLIEAAPPDLGVPDWELLKATACEGARLFSQFGLLGWDIGPAQTGPVILGVDPAPDFTLCQLAARRGVLEPEFLAFLADRRRLTGG